MIFGRVIDFEVQILMVDLMPVMTKPAPLSKESMAKVVEGLPKEMRYAFAYFGVSVFGPRSKAFDVKTFGDFVRTWDIGQLKDGTQGIRIKNPRACLETFAEKGLIIREEDGQYRISKEAEEVAAGLVKIEISLTDKFMEELLRAARA